MRCSRAAVPRAGQRGGGSGRPILRAALADPFWPLRAAHELGVTLPTLALAGAEARVLPGEPTGWPVHYERGALR